MSRPPTMAIGTSSGSRRCHPMRPACRTERRGSRSHAIYEVTFARRVGALWRPRHRSTDPLSGHQAGRRWGQTSPRPPRPESSQSTLASRWPWTCQAPGSSRAPPAIALATSSRPARARARARSRGCRVGRRPGNAGRRLLAEGAHGPGDLPEEPADGGPQLRVGAAAAGDRVQVDQRPAQAPDQDDRVLEGAHRLAQLVRGVADEPAPGVEAQAVLGLADRLPGLPDLLVELA